MKAVTITPENVSATLLRDLEQEIANTDSKVVALEQLIRFLFTERRRRLALICLHEQRPALRKQFCASVSGEYRTHIATAINHLRERREYRDALRTVFERAHPPLITEKRGVA